MKFWDLNQVVLIFILHAIPVMETFKRNYRGEDLYENDGFIVHYFSETKVNSLLNGFKKISLEKFEEGKFPRKLFFVVNEKK